MFDTNIMNFTKRVEIARHGFESVTMRLAQDYDGAARDLRQARHRDLGHAGAQGNPPVRPRSSERTRAWRRIFEQTTGALLRQSAGRRRQPAAAI